MEAFAPKRRNSEGTGFASLVDFLLANARVVLGVSGAAVLALATLAVKRLIDRATSPPDGDGDEKAKQKSLEESWQELSSAQTAPKPPHASRREALEEPLLLPAGSGPGHDSEDALPPPETLPAEVKARLCLTLQEKLLVCYQDRASASEAVRTLGRQLSEDICAELQTGLKKHAKLPFGRASLSVDLSEGLIGAGGTLEVNFLLPLVLEPDLWAPIPGEQTVVNDPRVWMIKRTAVEYFPRGSSPWDTFLVGGYFSSNAVTRALRKVLEASVNWPAIGSMLECVVRPAVAPDKLKLEVWHEQIGLDITLCPRAEAGDKTLLAAPFGEPVQHLWQQNFHAVELSRLKELDGRDSGVRQRCLHLLKAAFGTQPCWRKLTTGHLSHVLLHLSGTEPDWSEAALADRFRGALEDLLRRLEEASLPCCFDGRINLLGPLSAEEIEEIGYLLYEALAEPDLWDGIGL
ncbi:mitochondrial dynamics protein MID49 [Paroedura picta]|uniref:mitochondrial dynamics protein MID49 n=1 Tax=Paroedura picta TaxID=143630 RepID=UPI0040576732